MSDDSLQLSGELIQGIHEVLQRADPRTAEPIVAVQYLAAVLGYLVAQMEEPVEERKDFLAQLSEFMHAVFEDVDGRRSSAPAAPPQDASGVWRPGDA
jgi:hypothetical protein